VDHQNVRTTLTLDDDVAHLLNKEIRRTGASLKETVNNGLRTGLRPAPLTKQKPFKVKPRNLGLPAGLSYDCIGELIEALEGPRHR
jgi:hypothetical protein